MNNLEIRIPKEINEYKEKIIFGLSIRQLVSFLIAAALSVGTYFLCTKGLGLSMDATSYIIILVSVPILAIGFVRKDGFTFEKYISLIIRHKLGKQVRTYKTELTIDNIQIEKEGCTNNESAKKDRKSRKEKKLERQARECEIFTVTKADRKKKSKITSRKIKKARQEYRGQKRSAKKTAKKSSAA